MKKSTSVHRITFVTIAVVFFIVPFCTTKILAQARQQRNHPSDSFSSAFIQKAQHMIDQYREKVGTPGIAVAFYDNGKSCILVSGTTGDSQQSPVTGETEFAMGSVEKTFASTLLALAIVDGKAAIGDHAAQYLVGQGGDKVNNGVAFKKVTLKDLVTHTASLPDKIPGSKRKVGNNYFADHPVEKSTIQYLNNWNPPYPPGTKYEYSNLGFVLAGSIASSLLDKPYTKLLTKDITNPLGMTHTGLLCNPLGTGCAVGYNEEGKPSKEMAIGLWTNANDMLRYVEANLGDLQGSPELAQAIEKTHKELFRVDGEHAVGMGWEEWYHGDSLLLSKDGIDSGFGSWVGFEPTKHRGVVVLRNGGKNPGPGKLGSRLLALAESVQ